MKSFNRLFLSFLAITISSISFVNCSSHVAGGPGTGAETTNGYIFTSDKKPASGVTVYIIDREKWHENFLSGAPLVYDSSVTDSTGLFTFSSTLPNRYNIQVNGIEEGAIIENAELRPNNSSLTLSRYGTFKGSLIDPRLFSKRLSIAGTNYSVSMDGGKKTVFEFPSIAPGIFPVFADPESTVMVSVLHLKPDTTVIHSDMLVLDTSILAEDFESREFYITVLGRSTGSAWYIYNDALKENFNSTIVNHIRHLSTEQYALESNTVLQAEYTSHADTSFKPYAGIGFTLGESYIDLDTSLEFTSNTTLVFKAKGNGVVRIKFGSELTDSLYPGEWNDFGVYVTLEDSLNWKEYRITPDMLSLAYNDTTAGITWNNVKKGIIRIEFEFNGKRNPLNQALTLWLDDIYLEGINLEQLIKYQKTR